MVAPAKKLFYHVDEVCALLRLAVRDLAVLASEQQITLSTAVPSILVEDGFFAELPNGSHQAMPESEDWVRGIVALQPDDAWYILRHGSKTILGLQAEAGRFRRIASGSDEERGYTVMREELGVTHTELARYAALLSSLDDVDPPARSARGGQDRYDWRAADLEAFRWIYFEGVPESQGALIRHMAAWFASRGGKVPNESTLKRQMRHIWAEFGPEAKQRDP
jgi:hypothetical protein